MAYTHTTRLDLLYPLLYRTAIEQQSTNPNRLAHMAPPLVMRGRRFPCTPGMAILRQYHLSNEYVIRNRAREMPSIPTPRYVMVSGVNASYYPPLRVGIHSIHQQFPAGSYRLIVYDLDGSISKTKWMVEELRQVCHVEVRAFNATAHLRSTDPALISIHSFAWKPLIIADVFRDLDGANELLIYLDSSIRFHSPAKEFGSLYFNAMNDADGRRRLTPVQISSPSAHSIQFATHPTMYTWLPIDPLLGPLMMREAGFTIWRKTETSRQLLKWAVLCATTRECIVPSGQRLKCWVGKDPDAACHRQDQSLLNILVGNMEVDWWLEKRFSGQREKEDFAPHVLRDLGLPGVGKHPYPKCEPAWICTKGEGVPKWEVWRGVEDPKLSITPVGGKCS